MTGILQNYLPLVVFIGVAALIGLALLALASGNMSLITLGGLLFLLGLILVAPMLLRPIAFVFGRLTALLYARQGTGDLAQGNLTRQPSRVTITASATSRSSTNTAATSRPEAA